MEFSLKIDSTLKLSFIFTKSPIPFYIFGCPEYAPYIYFEVRHILKKQERELLEIQVFAFLIILCHLNKYCICF